MASTQVELVAVGVEAGQLGRLRRSRHRMPWSVLKWYLTQNASRRR